MKQDWIHYFSQEFAIKHGIHAAIVVQHMRDWIASNMKNGRNFRDGRTWTYNSVKGWHQEIPFLTESQIRRSLEYLVDKHILMAGNYNKKAYDRTLWYAFIDEIGVMGGKSSLASPNDEEDGGSLERQNHLSPATNGFATGDKPIPTPLPSSLSNKEAPAEPPSEVKKVTDLFWALYAERCQGKKPSWRMDFQPRTRDLIRANGLNSVLLAVHGYFELDLWFTKDKKTGKHMWSYAGFLARYDDVQSAVSEAPKDNSDYLDTNGAAAARLMGGGR